MKVLHVGTIIVLAQAMSLGEYNIYRGWDIPANEDPEQQGYLVEYANTVGNHKDHAGRIAWVDADSFLSMYVEDGKLNFSAALALLKNNDRVCRSGWNGKGMFIKYSGDTPGINPHFVIKGVHGTYDTWVPSVSDLLANDWQFYKG